MISFSVEGMELQNRVPSAKMMFRVEKNKASLISPELSEVGLGVACGIG